MSNPCLACGACCAYFRVSFHWSETERFLGGVTPTEHTVQVGTHRVAMRGTLGRNPRCVALEGTIGENVRCTIYERRPSPCREFPASWADGRRNERCDRARAAHGLPPLDPPGEKPAGKRAAR
ncbi:MAG TPA: YkgJ family cysteine cluster protein [Gammaproteobacteria bacterium]